MVILTWYNTDHSLTIAALSYPSIIVHSVDFQNSPRVWDTARTSDRDIICRKPWRIQKNCPDNQATFRYSYTCRFYFVHKTYIRESSQSKFKRKRTLLQEVCSHCSWASLRTSPTLQSNHHSVMTEPHYSFIPQVFTASSLEGGRNEMLAFVSTTCTS